MTPDTGTLTQVLETFLSSFKLGRTAVGSSAFSLLSILATLEILIASLWWALRGGEVVVKFLKKVLLIGFFTWVVTAWDNLIIQVINGFIYTGETASNAAGGSTVSIENPSAIVDAGFGAVFPIFEHIRTYDSPFAVMANFFDLLLTLICTFIIIGAFFVLAIQVFVTRLEFGLIATLGLILIPFGVFRQTSFLSEKVFGAVISFGIKLMVLSFIISITFPVLDQFTLPPNPSWPQLFSMMAVSLSIMALAWHAPGVAAGLLSGSPTLTAGGATGAALGSAAALTGGTIAASHGAHAARSTATSATKAATNTASSAAKGGAFSLGMYAGAKNAKGNTATNFASRVGSVATQSIKSSLSPLRDAGGKLKESFNSGRELKVISKNHNNNSSDTKSKTNNPLRKHIANLAATSSLPEEESPKGENTVPIRRDKK